MKLAELTSPRDLGQIPAQELPKLVQEIREEIIKTVAVNGGHLASNLGAVELTVALHRVLHCPEDKILFDVGHQCYTHKLLTGRQKQFASLRKTDGLCGFPRREESEYDVMDTGHASTAISAALGLARARDMQGEHYKVVAVVGDGALTGGMCYEALNDAGSRHTPMMIVVNDNGMSISRNVGALSRQLTRLRVSRGWLGAKKAVADALRRVPVGSNALYRGFQRIKNKARNVLVRDKYFTALGFRYFGPIDGHDLPGMERVFRQLLEMEEPVVVHVVTRKGNGFRDAEEKPEKYHGVSPFMPQDEKSGPTMGSAAGAYVTELAAGRPDICVVTAAMTDSTGFTPFAEKYPDRLFDVGIAEEHAVTLASGMAAGGLRPFVAIYETFLQRGFDQIMEDVCLQQLPVTFLMDRAGLGGEDGATHHGIYGVGMLRTMPGMRVLSPACEAELRAMIDWALSQSGPVAIRYPKNTKVHLPFAGFSAGRWDALRPGGDAAVIGVSAILEECLKAADILEKKGIRASVINASTLWPGDEGCLRRLAAERVPVFTVEEHALTGGLGSITAQICACAGLPGPRRMFSLPDAFIPHGNRKQLLARYGLTAEQIAAQIQKAVRT
ncbi:MAG: 1-deoxy-D-xylulose-5-phosphate synthase [Clostridia bacterium]|nr:1-deoxy-D-xylulose-5-phosphate synthase [Clostridia bacterium]